MKALTHRVARWQKGGARALAGAFVREEEKDWELQRNAKSLRVWPPSSTAELSPTRQRKNWRDGRSILQSQSGPGMRGQRSLLPTLALPLVNWNFTLPQSSSNSQPLRLNLPLGLFVRLSITSTKSFTRYMCV